MGPSLLFHSNITTYPSEPDSFLAVVRLPKSASLDSIVITPLGLKPFYYQPSDSDADYGQTPTKPAQIDLLFNARYPPPSTQSDTTSTLPSSPSTKAPKGWRPNSLHKSTLDYNPSICSSKGALSSVDLSSILAIQQFEIGMPLDVSTSLVVLRCPFAIITLSLYGYPATHSSIVPNEDQLSTANWESYLRNSSTQPPPNLPSDSFENVVLSLTRSNSGQADNGAVENDGQDEGEMAMDDPMPQETVNQPLQQRLVEILESLTHLIKSSEEQSSSHGEDIINHVSENASSTSTSSESFDLCTELILLNLIHFSEILGFLHCHSSLPAGSQLLLPSSSLDIPIHAIFRLLNWCTIAHWNEALTVSARIWIDLMRIPRISERLIHEFATTPDPNHPGYNIFYDLSAWRRVLCDLDSNQDFSSRDRATFTSLSRDLLHSSRPHHEARTGRLSERTEGEITPGGLFLFVERYFSVGFVCTGFSLPRQGDSYEEIAVKLGWLIRWLNRKEWQHICIHHLNQTSIFSTLLHLTTSKSSLGPTAHSIVEKLLTSAVVSTSHCIFKSLHTLRLLGSSLSAPSPTPISPSSPASLPSTFSERLQIVIDCTEYTTSNVLFEHLLSRFIHLAQSISSNPTSLAIFQAHLYLLHALRSFPQISKKLLSSDRLMARSFWILYLGLAVELHETLSTCFWNGVDDFVRTPPFIRLSHLTHQRSEAKNTGEMTTMLEALGELGASLTNLIGCILNVIMHELPPTLSTRPPTSSFGRSETEHLIETKTTNSLIVRAIWDAISTFVRAEFFSRLLSNKEGDIHLIDSEAERLRGGLDTSMSNSLDVLFQLTSLSSWSVDENEMKAQDDEKRLDLVVRTIIEYALSAGDEGVREILGTLIGRLVPDPSPSSLSSFSTLQTSSAEWEVWDRILHQNSMQLTFLVLSLNPNAPSNQHFLDKVRRFLSPSTEIFNSTHPSLRSNSPAKDDDEMGEGPVGQVSSTSIIEWMLAPPVSTSETATDSTSPITSATTSNSVHGLVSTIVSMTPTMMTTTSATTVTSIPIVPTSAVLGGTASAPIQRTTKTYRQNEFRSSRSSNLIVSPGASLAISSGSSGNVAGRSVGPGGLGGGVIGNGGGIQKINASRAPSKHVDEFELEIELESQRKRAEGGN